MLFSINDALNIFIDDWETKEKKKKNEKYSKEKESRDKLEYKLL